MKIGRLVIEFFFPKVRAKYCYWINTGKKLDLTEKRMHACTLLTIHQEMSLAIYDMRCDQWHLTLLSFQRISSFTCVSPNNQNGYQHRQSFEIAL